MTEPLFLRPEDSGTEQSPLTILGEAGATLCGDPRQTHTQIWPEEGMARIAAFDTDNRTIAIPTPPDDVFSTKHLEMVVH